MKTRKLHARVLQRNGAPGTSFFLNESELRFAAECERMRVDRNGSILSLLLIRLSEHHSAESDLALLSRVLEGRLRTTDTPGKLDDGHIAVLLPDTPAEGAWKLASDISEVYPPGPSRPECDVLVYPQRNYPRQEEFSQEELEQTATELGGETSGEFFFARSLPRWKRTIDIFGSIVGMLVSSPVILCSAVVVKLSSHGPIFFCQEREGLGGKRFLIWKLRTMAHDAEQKQHALRALSHQDGPAFKMKRDPRTTSVGRFLRWSSIDELPQFWNVLKGDMSLVGPRPLPTVESQACTGWQRRRLEVNPGITCIWQVNGRGQVRFDDWVRMDLHYIHRYSFWEDLRLLLSTLPALIFHKGIR